MKKGFWDGCQAITPSSTINETKEKMIVSDKPPQANLSEKKKSIISFC